MSLVYEYEKNFTPQCQMGPPWTAINISFFALETYRNYTEGIFYDAMDFWPDGEHGIAFGDPIDGRMTLIKTDDGGDTWHDIPFEERPEVPQGVHAFAASGTCLRAHVSSTII